MRILNSLAKGELETPKKTNPIFSNVAKPVVMGTAKQSLDAAKEFAEKQGINAVVLSDCIEGEAREVGRVLGSIALGLSNIESEAFTKPLLLLSGGETTVTVKGGGRGGRNAEFLLGLTESLHGDKRIFALAAESRTELNKDQKQQLLKFLWDNLDGVTNLDLRLPQKIAAEMKTNSNWRQVCEVLIRA
jgi:hydroxypyruvate reductase